MLSDYRKSTAELNIVQSFKRSGIIVLWNKNHNNLIALLYKEQTKSVKHWQVQKIRIQILNFDP
jgi:hypothetical protein